MQQPIHLQTASTYDIDRRIITIGLVALIHVLLVYAFINSIHVVRIFVDPGPLTGRFVETVQPKKPPQPHVKWVMPATTPIPLPPISFGSGNTDGGITIEGQDGNGIAIAAIPPRRIGGQSQPPYPAIARRLGEEGDVLLQISITDSGRVSDVSVLQSSGSERLDSAARDWVLAHWRYQPATRDGKPVATTTKAKIQFRVSSER